MTNIQTLLGLAGVERKNFPKAVAVPNPCPTLLYGVELEIEGVGDADSWKVPGMSYERDGSLRNNGMEFITNPMTYSNLKYCLELFFGKNKPTQDNYSERTSIHVHTNCQDLTWEQLRGVCLVYQMMEKLLFSWVGGDRDKNIFCVPWHQTTLTYSVLKDDHEVTKFRKWQKYTALNLLPLYTQGTIEWRHMYGHGDVDKIMQWCTIIGHIYAYALATPLETIKNNISSLNVSSEYEGFLFSVFQENAKLFTAVPMFAVALEEGILDTKYALMDSPIKKSPPLKRAPRFVINNPQANANWIAVNELENWIQHNMPQEAPPVPEEQV